METENFISKYLKDYLSQSTDAAPLAVFRIFFGALITISVIRFYLNGWIEQLYIEPKFFFSYYGFEWAKPLGSFTYLLFIICATAAILVMLGAWYRISISVLFLSFTYIELMDKTTYLNHYYFVSLLSFLLIFLPAAAHFSVDAKRNPKISFRYVPKWTLDALRLFIAVVYFYAGLAKLNSDWLMSAMPLKIWLTAKSEMPIIGGLLQEEWVQYVFSWSGAIYDLTIPFLLLYKKTRPFAFFAVLVFHTLTAVLFPIGMFPYIMIFSALIFFDPKWHHNLLHRIKSLFNISPNTVQSVLTYPLNFKTKFRFAILALFFCLHLFFPFRYLLYPGELFWTEQGYRFSWRVMLMEKAGYANFKVVDPDSGKSFYVNNRQFLNPFQEKQMSTQPDFILEYAHFLADTYRDQGILRPEVYVESYVALNGRPSQPYINPNINLAEVEFSYKPYNWLLPFNDEIKGL